MIDKLRYWCHKILPLVYDDSLSYYEFLCKMNAKLNEVIDSTNGLMEAWERFQAELEKAWEDYKSALTAEWADYRAEMDLKYATLVGTVNTEINAIKTDISTFKNDISNQITTFEAKVDGDYAEFTAAIEAKINAFIAKYNAEIAKIPDEITRLVNAWWQNEANYNKLVTDVANAIDTTLTSGAVISPDVLTMTSSSVSLVPTRSIVVCRNYYSNDNISTMWVVVSGDISDGVSRLLVGSDRTAILLSEQNADTLGLRGALESVGRRKLLTMATKGYSSLKIVKGDTLLYIPRTTDIGSASITPLAIYGDNVNTQATLYFPDSDCPFIESISNLRAFLRGQNNTLDVKMSFSIADSEIHSFIHPIFARVSFDRVWWRDGGTGVKFAPTADDSYPHISDSRFSFMSPTISVALPVYNARGFNFIGNALWVQSPAQSGNTRGMLSIDGNASAITLRDNLFYSQSDDPANGFTVLASCANFSETGKAIICEGNRNEIGGVSHPTTMLTGDIPCDIIYVNNTIRYGSRYTLSDIPTTGNFNPALVAGVTHPIGYLETSENQIIVHGTPLTLTYPTTSHWTADEVGYIALSSDRNAEYKVTVKGVIRVSGQESAGNVKVSLSGQATESRTISVTANLEYVPISVDFSYGTGGGFSVVVSSETANMTVIIREATVLIERIN